MKPTQLAIDIGGTKIEIAYFDDNFTLLESKKFPTADFSIKTIQFLDEVEELIKKHVVSGIKKIGISFNCVINKGSIVYSSLLGGPVGRNISEDWGKLFGIPVAIENDVNAMALTEYHKGKGQGSSHMLLINIGTGIRLSYVIDGKVMGGFSNNAGEISQRNMIIPELNNQVIAIDHFLSGQGLTNIYRILSDKDKTAKDIFVDEDRDPIAKKAVDIFRKYFGIFLQEVSYFYNPEVIIINGSLKKAADQFLPQSEQYYKDNTYNFFFYKNIYLSDIDHGAALGSLLLFE